jgi:pimeloyl-ACP methyl ester carboxylesterase
MSALVWLALTGSVLGTAGRVAPHIALFVHGAGGGGWEWNAWRPVFEKAGYRCIAEDLIPTKGGIASTRFADYVAQVEQMGKSHRAGKLVLVGASMGGILALKAAESLHPDAIVLVNSVGPAGIGTPKAKQYPKVIEWSKGTLQETRDSMPDSDEATIQFAFRHWRDESGAVLEEISKGIEVKPPKCPVLCVLGDRDTDVPNAVGFEMAKRFGGIVDVFPDMSHVGPLLGTRAANVADAVVTWLEKQIR